jgi:hypothetical protein
MGVRALRIPDSRLAARAPIGAPELALDDLDAIARGLAFGYIAVAVGAEVVFSSLQKPILESAGSARELVSLALGVDNFVEALGSEDAATLTARSTCRRERLETHRELDRAGITSEPVKIRRPPPPQSVDSPILEILTKRGTRKGSGATALETELGLTLGERRAHRSRT